MLCIFEVGFLLSETRFQIYYDEFILIKYKFGVYRRDVLIQGLVTIHFPVRITSVHDYQVL